MRNKLLKRAESLALAIALTMSTIAYNTVPAFADVLDDNDVLSEEINDSDSIVSNNQMNVDNDESSLISHDMYTESSDYIPVDTVNVTAMGTVTPLPPLDVNDAQAEGDLKPYSNFLWLYDADDNRIDPNLSKTDLSKNKKLLYSLTFSDTTQFSSLPSDVDTNEVLEWGKAPGLGVDILHKHGFDGTGITIAYVDQRIDNHEQFRDIKLHYTNNNDKQQCDDHGMTVLSFLAGKDMGTAPGAEIYYYAQRFAKDADQKMLADCLYQIIEQNKELPEGKKIRMVGFSNNIIDDRPNVELLKKAVKDCEDSGVMVWFCGDYDTCVFGAESDRNNPDNLFPNPLYYCGDPKLVHVPSSGRTSAVSNNGSKYVYWGGDGGLSWTMPYTLGVYADALAIDPSLTKEEIRNLIVSTATTNISGLRVINPVEFVATVLERVNRQADADSLRLDYKKSFHYIYALMDKSKMTQADISASEDYLRSIKGVTVLEVDVSSCSSSSEVYMTLKNDAEKRGGTIDGIQIFGTPDAVPAFDIEYRVKMINAQGTEEIDEGGTMKTDLFYGNLKNDVNGIGSSYSVYDQFKDNKNIVLKPEWPVVRLPLKNGQYKSYFEKYDDFALKTRYARLPLVNFSSPIFPQRVHIDDMGIFLDRARDEFKILNKDEYRLYGNQMGQYPVENSDLLGGFTAENLEKENEAGISEFLINSHGQRDNIDKCWFENNEEKRESLINSDTINTVLSSNPYYLDCWTCNNGYDMDNNLTTTALNGSCVGMFSATTVLSNNGANCRVSLDQMKNSNFYYFYYNYIKSLYEGYTRADSFFKAQVSYAEALIDDSTGSIRGEGNYQFNLYNLLTYENFGIMEPRTVTNNSSVYPVETNETIVAGQKINLKEKCFANIKEDIARYEVEDKTLAGISKEMLTGKKAGTVKVIAQKKIGNKQYQPVGVCTVLILNKPKLKFTKPMTYVGQTINATDYFQTEDTKTLGATYWESSKQSVVEVIDAKTGMLKAKGAGTAKITAYFGEKGKPGTFKVSANISVKIPAYAKTEYKLQTGAKQTLSMKNVTGASDPEWHAEDESKLRVTTLRNNKGVKTGKVAIEGLSCGDSKLIAVIDGQEYECMVHVAQPVINKSSMEIKAGKSGTVSLKNTKIKKADVKWESKNPSVATVDANGKIIGVSVGETIIYTNTGGYRNECKVTVK